jgi:hypothetical protein
MRLSDAKMRWCQPKLIYPDHRVPHWLPEDDIPRSLEPIVRGPVTGMGVNNPV